MATNVVHFGFIDLLSLAHKCETEFGMFPVIDTKKRKFLVKYDLSDNMLCQLCKNCNEIVGHCVIEFIV